MIYETEYTFDELALVAGCACYAYGVADVSYTVLPPDRLCGYMNWSIDDLHITGIALDGIDMSDPGRQLDSTEPLYKLIEAALFRDDALTQACLEHYEGGGAWAE
jgi:hypothetical protein